MNIGPKLRSIRRQRDLTLQDVADATGLSKSFISKIESDSGNPTLASIEKICLAIGAPLAELFQSEASRVEPAPPSQRGVRGQGVYRPDVRVVRADQRRALLNPTAISTTYLLSPDVQHTLQAQLDVYEPGEGRVASFDRHSGEEFGIVLEGAIEMEIDGELYQLEAGDSISYPASLPHRDRALPGTGAVVLWVVTPPYI
jgi:transcriptional regulator with XRE-family HTH domain/quercetin dioxygenase-like cupin family protein